MFKDNINGNRTTSMTLFRYLYCQNIKHFSHFLSISIDDFEQKNARWVLSSVKRESRVSVVDWDLLWHLRFSAPTASCLQITRTLLIGIYFIKCWDGNNYDLVELVIIYAIYIIYAIHITCVHARELIQKFWD